MRLGRIGVESQRREAAKKTKNNFPCLRSTDPALVCCDDQETAHQASFLRWENSLVVNNETVSRRGAKHCSGLDLFPSVAESARIVYSGVVFFFQPAGVSQIRIRNQCESVTIFAALTEKLTE